MPVWPPLEGGQKISTTITSSGATTTANASANTKGSYTQLTAGSGRGSDGFYLNVLAGTASRDFLVDLAIGGAGSERVIVSNLLVSSSSTATVDVVDYFIPIPIPPNVRVAARCQASAGSAQCFVGITTVESDYLAGFRFARATTYGADTSDSGGTVVDPGGSANTLGAWAQLNASITAPIKYALVCFGARNNFTRTAANMTVQIGKGAGGSEQVQVGGMYTAQDAGRDNFNPYGYARFVSYKQGERLSARAQSSTTDATDRLIDVVVIGFD